ncbi:MAG: hypothetical protein ACYDAD_00535, partial [Acidimicrobiales bacterium]
MLPPTTAGKRLLPAPSEPPSGVIWDLVLCDPPPETLMGGPDPAGGTVSPGERGRPGSPPQTPMQIAEVITGVVVDGQGAPEVVAHPLVVVLPGWVVDGQGAPEVVAHPLVVVLPGWVVDGQGLGTPAGVKHPLVVVLPGWVVTVVVGHGAGFPNGSMQREVEVETSAKAPAGVAVAEVVEAPASWFGPSRYREPRASNKVMAGRPRAPSAAPSNPMSAPFADGFGVGRSRSRYGARGWPGA